MADAPFYNPSILTDDFDLAISQQNKSISFVLEAPNVVSPSAKIVTTYNGKVVETYTVGDGLSIVNDQTVTLTLQGADYASYADPDSNHTVKAWCTLVNPGDPEIIFDLQIIYSPL